MRGSQVCPLLSSLDANTLAYARKILESAETHMGQGRGAWEVDGKMIDMPMVVSLTLISYLSKQNFILEITTQVKWAQKIVQRAD